MTGTENARATCTVQIRTNPSEVEVSELLQGVARQYEEYMRLADLADISEMDEVSQPRYAWDNPIGLVVAE